MEVEYHTGDRDSRDRRPGQKTVMQVCTAAVWTWMTGTYDAALNLLYWGIGNPNPVLAGEQRPGDNLYTCSIVALNPDTGKLVGISSRLRTMFTIGMRYRLRFCLMRISKERNGKLLAQASRNGFYFLLDRTSGENLATAPFIDQTWASGVGQARGAQSPSRRPRRVRMAALVEPASDGATNWMAPSFDPQTKLFYVNARRIFSVYYHTANRQTQKDGAGGTGIYGPIRRFAGWTIKPVT